MTTGSSGTIGPPGFIGPPVPNPGAGGGFPPPNFLGPPVPNPGTGGSGYPDGTLIKSSAGDPVAVMIGGVRHWIPNPATFLCMGFDWNSIQVVPDYIWQSIPAGPDMPMLAAGSCAAINPPTPAPAPAPVPVVSAGAPAVTPIPTTGPLPPGAGYQQVELPGSTYPYVYIGQGSASGIPGASSYPDGTLLKSSAGDAVYVIVGGMRHWIPNPATFTAMGLNWASIQTVADATLQNIPTGPAMPDLSGAITYPSTTALNVPMPNGTVLNPSGLPASFASPGIGSQISDFFSQYGIWIGVGLGGLLLFKVFSGPGGRR